MIAHFEKECLLITLHHTVLQVLKSVKEQLFNSSVSAVRTMAPAGQLLRCSGDISDLEHTGMGGKLLTDAVTVLLIFPIGPERQFYFSALKD